MFPSHKNLGFSLHQSASRTLRLAGLAFVLVFVAQAIAGAASLAGDGVTASGNANLSGLSGINMDSSSQQLSLLYAGDANMDGVVNVRDLLALAMHWQAPGAWANGDFNHDGIVNAKDLTLLARNWQADNVGVIVDPGMDDLLTSLNLPATSVPEPAALGVVCLLGMLAIRNARP